MSTKVDRYRQYAENARRRSSELHQSSRDAVGDIPFGQPILVGHHSERRHRNALERSSRKMQQSISEQERADYWNTRADRVEYRERQLEHAKKFSAVVEGEFENGEEVVARFTNCNRFLSFRGVIVGRTKNDWKVKALTSPYEEEQPGRVFYIPTASSRKHSHNNCIEKIEATTKEPVSDEVP